MTFDNNTTTTTTTNTSRGLNIFGGDQGAVWQRAENNML